MAAAVNLRGCTQPPQRQCTEVSGCNCHRVPAVPRTLFSHAASLRPIIHHPSHHVHPWHGPLGSEAQLPSPRQALPCSSKPPLSHLKRLKKATSQRQQNFGVDTAASVCSTGSEMFLPSTTEQFLISDFYCKVTGSCMFIIYCWK